MAYDAPNSPDSAETPSSAEDALAPAFAELAEFAAKPTPPARRRLAADVWAVIGCNAIVFMTSICIMVMELTASRLIAKTLGQSLYTWTSVIGVVLAGISGGNFLGGWLADRFVPSKLLGYLFWISSLLCLSVYPFHQLSAISERPEWLSWPSWVVFIVAANFLLPAVALGTISPVAASLALARSARTGVTVGNIYAWGALGSIVGTFLTGFYLVSTFGSQHIIWMTSATLAIMGMLVASRQWAFRGAMLFGWLQFVCWIGMFAAVTTVGTEEGTWENRVYGAMRQLGLELRLRSDVPDEYTDESNYFYISVADQTEKGEVVKALHLDHLTHSYFNPDRPTTLYYDYELVYAAVTERAASTWNRTTSVPIGDVLPEGARDRLPTRVQLTEDGQRLSIRGAMTDALRRELLSLSPSGPFWEAVEILCQEDNENLFGSLASAPLKELPEGLEIPPSLERRVRYDANIEALVRYEVLEESDREVLMAIAPDDRYRRQVENLFRRSRRVSTFFIGGGGFVFPRWIEAKFPERPVIDVAELDPAVKKAVQEAMGLPPDGETAINTLIGDARNTVDDRLRENSRLEAAGKPSLRYDFAYGDAFNDFSVPWHLTTLEFTEKVKHLLKPDGVFLVNIIDIFPRATYPADEPRGYGEVSVSGPLPSRWGDLPLRTGQWSPADKAFAPLEIMREDPPGMRLRFQQAMTVAQRDQLLNSLRDDTPHRKLRLDLLDLYRQTNEVKSWNGTLPKELQAEVWPENEWVSATLPYQNFEVLQLEDNGYQLGYRGIMTDADRKQLQALAPADKEFTAAIAELQIASEKQQPGRFLGSYVRTVCQVFPYVYVFTSNYGLPSSERDTFVVACANRALNLEDLGSAGNYWEGSPFAMMETDANGKQQYSGQMSAVIQLSRGMTLTDDFAPVDNLLVPVFSDQ